MNPRVAFDDCHREVISLCLRWALNLCPEQHRKTKVDTCSTDGQLPATPEEVRNISGHNHRDNDGDNDDNDDVDGDDNSDDNIVMIMMVTIIMMMIMMTD